MTVMATGMAVRGVRSSEPPLFLVDTPFDPQPTGIYTVEPATGLMTLRASLDVSYGPVLGLAAANDSVLYATGSDPDGCFTCFLYRITLDPAATTPLEVLPIGRFLDGTTLVDGVTQMAFRNDGTLWITDEHTEGLYTVDAATAAVTRIGTVSTDVQGGDLTFDGAGTLWMWSNAPSDHGLYELDPVTAEVDLFILRPDLRFAGLAALGDSNVLYGANPGTDTLHEILVPSGFTGSQPALFLDGAPFDHKRGDLDSPRCSNDAWCDDLDVCTTDTCTPGGCAHVPNAAACDDGNPCTSGDECAEGVCQPGGMVGPAEASGFFAVDKVTFAWSTVPGATAYDAVRGSTSELPVGPGGGDETGFAGLGAPVLVDPTEPSPGGAFWYVVRGSGTCGAGSYGTRSDGTLRETTTCP